MATVPIQGKQPPVARIRRARKAKDASLRRDSTSRGGEKSQQQRHEQACV